MEGEEWKEKGGGRERVEGERKGEYSVPFTFPWGSTVLKEYRLVLEGTFLGTRLS